MIKKIDAVVFGAFETGLGVIRSLGIKGLKVLNIDFKKDIAWYSRYTTISARCPHPLKEEGRFITWIQKYFLNYNQKFPVFLTSDDFLEVFSRNRDDLSKYFIFNLASQSLLKNISNKYSQLKLAKEAGIEVPRTFEFSNPEEMDILSLPNDLNFPLFIKGMDVNLWREKIKETKGYEVTNIQEMSQRIDELKELNIPVIVQEIILGPDTNNYKYCSYTTERGVILAEFTLQKIRQYPIKYGVGTVVESGLFDNVMKTGRKLFQKIGFQGVGSIEFKNDDRDGKLKLIEINPRYWQQNYLPTACEVNFAYSNYRDIMDMNMNGISNKGYSQGVKWINRYTDFKSFLGYRKTGELTFQDWRESLKGSKVYSDFIWRDPLPGLYYLGFGSKLFKVVPFFMKHIFENMRQKDAKK